MALKKSIFLSDYVASFITATTSGCDDDDPKWSNAINASIEQYRHLLVNALPDLSSAEWQMILNTYAGCYMPAHNFPPRVASDMMDDMGEISLEKIEALMPEKAALIRKVHAMSNLEQMAILYFNQVFWLNDWSQCTNFDDVKKGVIYKLTK